MSHLDETTWERLALDELAPEDRQRALAHVVSCPRCTTVWKSVLALEREARAFDPSGPPPRVLAPRSRRWLAGGVAVALAAAAVLAIVLVRRPHDEGRVLRGSGATLEVASPRGEVGRPVRFAWTPVAGADRYRLELFSGPGELAWSTTVTDGPYEVPAGVELGQARFARVTALAGDRPITSSRLVEITIR